MIPIEVHLSLNHVPLVGLALGLAFFVSGLARSATAAVLAGLRVFVAMGIIVLPVVGSGLMSTTALANATWLDVSAVSRHQLAGIVTLVVLVTLAALSGAMLWVSRNTSTLPRWGRTTILVLALVGFGTCLWTAYVGGRLRHSELRPPKSERTMERRKDEQRSRCWGPPSKDLTRRGCLDITRVRRPGRLNEEHVRLYFRKRLVLHPARNDEQLPWIENHRSNAQPDLEPSGQHEEEIIGLVVFMPDEFAYVHVRSALNNCYQCRIDRM
jgi:hypothetical protein